MKKMIKIFSTVILITLPFSCKEEFLDVAPQNEYFSSNFYVSEEQALQGLFAAYDPLQWTFVGAAASAINGNWTSTVMAGEIWSDNANAGGDPSNFDQPGWQQIDDLNASPETPEASAFWKKYYWALNKANQVINNVKIESPVIDQYKAEAKFLRAYYLFELYRYFGPIPVITGQPSLTDRSIKRNTLTEVFTQITEDLKAAVPLLPLSYSSEFAGRVTKGAAQALLGKAYLYWADLNGDDAAIFDLAAASLKSVVESGQYTLLDNYSELFAFGAANNSESVFEIQYSSEVPADFGVPFQFINGNMIVQLCGVRGMCTNHPQYNPGWGFLVPTANLYNSYLPDDLYRRDATILSNTELALGGCPVDVRQANQTDFQGYWQQKYANYKGYTAAQGEINVLKDANEPVIRYADVLLMYAEALTRGTGSTSDAMDAIDIVRERAQGPGNNTTFRTAADLMLEEGWTLLEVIQYERRAELAGEGDRWFDLVRSGRATATLFPVGDLRRTNFDTNDQYLPIPQTEIDFFGGNLTAYPDATLFQ
jgi:starch-binding outer membrane protein, SusD/RagB family